MARYVLGVACYYHDASATLLRDGHVVAAAEEERFSRKKHDSSFPYQAITFCLEQAGITIDAVEAVAFYEKPLLKFERILYQHLATFPKSYKTFLQAMPSWATAKLRLIRTLKKTIGYYGPVYFVHHHMAHAASAFLPSPFTEAAIITVDGVGEWSTTAWGRGQGSEITLEADIQFPHSLGLLYSTITAYLGFSVNNSEYKVMGLAAYGTMDRTRNLWYQRLRNVIDIQEDGSFWLDMDYFTYHWADRMPSARLCKLLGGPVLARDSAMGQRHKDIAAAVQLLTEDALTKILHYAHRQTKCDAVTLAGGVALNSVYNGKILSSTPFTRVWIQPNASDGGTSMGAALYVDTNILDHPRAWQLQHAYLGPRYTNNEVEDFLKENNIRYSRFKDQTDLLHTTARLLNANKVVGWFQGAMEWGPRALGARSILANPCNPEAKELLNTKVKHRERFRPFAPVVCADDAATYFVIDIPLPAAADFMLLVYPIRAKWQTVIPAVTHVDGSGRLQTVQRHQNSLYYDLLKQFERESGVPILINTSFNIRGEPIVCTPYDAFRCMMGTEIDYLVMEGFLIKRDDNLSHAWEPIVSSHD